MPQRDFLTHASSELLTDVENGVVNVTIRDEVSQRDFKVSVPLHLAGVLVAMLTKAREDRPDLFACVSGVFTP